MVVVVVLVASGELHTVMVSVAGQRDLGATGRALGDHVAVVDGSQVWLESTVTVSPCPWRPVVAWRSLADHALHDHLAGRPTRWSG